MFTSPVLNRLPLIAVAAYAVLTIPFYVDFSSPDTVPVSVETSATETISSQHGEYKSVPAVPLDSTADVLPGDATDQPGRLLPGTPATPDTGSVSGNYGDTLTVDGVRVTLSGLRFDPCSGSDHESWPGETYVIADATITNDSFAGEPDYYGSFMSAWELNYYVPGSVGEYSADYPINHCHTFDNDSVFDGDYLSVGNTVRVTVIFAVPTNAVDLSITWNGSTSLPPNTATFALNV